VQRSVSILIRYDCAVLATQHEKHLSRRTPSPAAGPSPAPRGRHTSRHSTFTSTRPAGRRLRRHTSPSPAGAFFTSARAARPLRADTEYLDRHEARIPMEPLGRDTIPPSTSAIIFTCTHQSPPSLLIHNNHSNRSLLPTTSCVDLHALPLTGALTGIEY